MKKAVVVAVLLSFCSGLAYADTASSGLEERLRALEEKLARNSELQERVVSLERENQVLKDRISSLEETQPAAAAQAKDEKPKPEPAMMDKVGSKLKVKGRWGAGFFKSGQGGSYPQGSFEAPEAKVQLAFEPDKHNTVVTRMNLNNAAFNNLDYFYVDSKNFLPFLEETPFTLESRLGRFKLPYGEETFSNNIVESALISNSAANLAGSDEGVQLSGKLFKDNPLGLKWFFAASNGNSGTGSDNVSPKSYAGKLSLTPLKPLYLSASVYNSGGLKNGASEVSIAGITARPAGATQWDRTAWEVDARYDIGKGKVMDPPAYTDSKAYLRGAFGQVYDDASVLATGADLDRAADYGFVEALCNFHPKWYVAGRYSLVDMHDGAGAVLNGVTGATQYLSTQYERYSAALGYRWSDKTLIKLGYDINDADVVHPDGDPSDNLLSLVLASSF